jgi:5-formyltetrahydrofolate cyclo-ligase
MLSPSERDLLRREMRARRRALTPAQRAECAHRFALVAKRARLFRPRLKIALYVPYGAEADPSVLMQVARSLHCRVHLPVITDYRRSRMRFVPFDDVDRLVRNRYGIPEPLGHRQANIAVSHLDLVILPLVAVDERGWRLGSGAGFYDRCLRHLGRTRSWRRPKLVGLGYEFQRVPQLAFQPWDVPLDAVLTEQGLYAARRAESGVTV